MHSIQDAYDWSIERCSAPNVGYSQAYRNERTVNGITYYDCSSFIWYALIRAGWDMVKIYGGTWPFTTRTMEPVLQKMGFTKYPGNSQWKKGDILMASGHTEFAFDTTRSMGAHTDKVPLPEQVSINANNSTGSRWYALWRWEQGATSDWISGNRFLSIGEMQNNATIIYSELVDKKGWSPESVSGMLGNMQVESSINPGIWQNLNPNPKLGWGLVQWTPSTNYTNWAGTHGYTNDDGYGQLEWLDTETVPSGQWIPTSQYPETFAQFKVSKQTPEYLADAFLKNFERPGDINQPIRQKYARYWYDWYMGDYVPPDNPPNNGGDWSAKMPIWLYLRKEEP